MSDIAVLWKVVECCQADQPPSTDILEPKLLEVGRRPEAGMAIEEMWMKWSPDSKWIQPPCLVRFKVCAASTPYGLV